MLMQRRRNVYFPSTHFRYIDWSPVNYTATDKLKREEHIYIFIISVM
jgi:hypothetical protein